MIGARPTRPVSQRPAFLQDSTWCLACIFVLLLATHVSATCASCGHSRFPTPGACVVSGTTVDPHAEGCCADEEAVQLIGRIIDELGGSAYEATAATTEKGNSPFGAAILANKQGYPLLHADANQVQTAGTPTAHGEISTINSYFQQTSEDERTSPGDTIFLATHAPCSMCLSGLAFGGFRRVFYGFDFAMSVNGGDEAGDILDVSVLEEVFTTPCGHIDHTNGMFTIIPVQAVLQMKPCDDNKHIAAALLKDQKRFLEIRERYVELGRVFQARMAATGGGINGVQLLAKACVGCKPFPRDECGCKQYDPNMAGQGVAEDKSEL